MSIVSCFIQSIYHNKWLLYELAKKDFQQRYVGSFLGIWWAFIQPAITVLIFWFVFQIGFKVVPINNVPFLLWLITGMFPWFFITDSISGATNSIVENSYLVKKVVFRVSLLPLVKIISALTVHVFFIVALFILYIAYGFTPSIYNLGVLYYLFAMIVLVVGTSWITSATVIFFKDLGVIIGMLLQIGFWITPIFWNINMIPEKYIPFLELNPAFYIIEGYRQSFISHVWFWEDIGGMLYFWSVTIVISIIGIVLFKKLRPHFADVL